MPDSAKIEPGKTGRVLIGACGAVSVLMLPSYLATLRAQVNCLTTVVMTPAATRFLPPRTIGLVADTVVDGSEPDTVFRTNHVRLAADHDIVLVLPATANTLAEIAHGHASNILTAAVLATPPPVMIVPAMNRSMWTNPTVRRNVDQIRADGHDVLAPEMGSGFETSTRSWADNPVLAAPSKIATLVAERLAAVRPSDDDDAGAAVR